MALWNYEYSLNFRYLSTFFVDVGKAKEINNLSNTSCLPVYQLKYRLCVKSSGPVLGNFHERCGGGASKRALLTRLLGVIVGNE